MPKRARLLLLFAAIALVTLGVAQLTGYLVNSRIPENTTVVINGLVHFTHVRNHGGVFGMLQGSGWLFATISALLLVAVTAYLARGHEVQRYEFICFGFIVGGGASNVLDRFLYGSVIDFIDIQHIPYWHYVFNIADVMVHVGIWPMLLFSLRTGGRNRPAPTN
ncbi:MAG: signal peptidase II [Gammaproteobacteria bacterium]|nr:signal peptidase II [Pseudomonadales bacterium]MCP5346919.1 signal peptidase II [Pseudomonadales bacterium]